MSSVSPLNISDMNLSHCGHVASKSNAHPQTLVNRSSRSGSLSIACGLLKSIVVPTVFSIIGLRSRSSGATDISGNVLASLTMLVRPRAVSVV